MSTTMKTYKGKRLENGNYASDNIITVDGVAFEPLMLEKSLKVQFHSPTGFSWGYGGSGPHQLALAILMHSNNNEIAKKCHHQFVIDYVCKWKDEWQITDEDIQKWLDERVGVE